MYNYENHPLGLKDRAINIQGMNEIFPFLFDWPLHKNKHCSFLSLKDYCL
jgi:hypothetical protein